MIGRYLWAVALTAATALSASAQAKDKDKYKDRDSDRDLEYTSRLDTLLPLSRNGAVEIRLHGGEIVVAGWSRNEVKVRGTSERGQLRVQASPSHVEIGAHSIRGRYGDTRVEVNVPEGTRLTVSGHSAD